MTGTRQTYRARVLRVLNGSPDWLQAREVARRTGLTYHQTIFALNALLNVAAIARQGRKSTARWGSVVLVEHDPTADALTLLESLFFSSPPTDPAPLPLPLAPTDPPPTGGAPASAGGGASSHIGPPSGREI